MEKSKKSLTAIKKKGEKLLLSSPLQKEDNHEKE
jgi:hypothetical protein